MLFNNWKTNIDDWNRELYQIDTQNKERLFLVLQQTVINNVENTNEHEIGKNQLIEIITDDTLDQITNNNNFNILSDMENLNNILKVLNWCSNNCLNNIECNEISETNNIKLTRFVNAINWICLILHYFVTELNMPEIKDRTFVGLTRSSYKLCPQKSNCCYQYPDDENSNYGCKNQHFPYTNLYSDALSIKTYISNKLNNDNQTKTSKILSTYSKINFDESELKRCLSTLTYVILIIYRELETIVKYRSTNPNFNIRQFHKYHQVHKFNKYTVENEYKSNKHNINQHNSVIFERENIPYRSSTDMSRSHKFTQLKEANAAQKTKRYTHN